MGKLQEKMREEMILRGFAQNTIDGYLSRCRYFAKHYMRSPADMGEQEIRKFLLYLMEEKNSTASNYKAYVVSLRFLYKQVLNRPDVVRNIPYPKTPKTLPVVLSRTEVIRILGALDNYFDWQKRRGLPLSTCFVPTTRRQVIASWRR